MMMNRGVFSTTLLAGAAASLITRLILKAAGLPDGGFAGSDFSFKRIRQSRIAP